MKTLLNALKQRDEGGPDVILQFGALKFEFITYGDGTFAIRRERGGLMSHVFKATWVGVKAAMVWIDENN